MKIICIYISICHMYQISFSLYIYQIFALPPSRSICKIKITGLWFSISHTNKTVLCDDNKLSNRLPGRFENLEYATDKMTTDVFQLLY